MLSGNSALERLSADSIVTLCTYVTTPEMGMLGSSSKEIQQGIQHPAIWKNRFGALGKSIDASNAHESDDWRNRFLEAYMLDKGGRCCLCYGATPNEIMVDFGLRVCHVCISCKLVNKTKAKELSLLSEKVCMPLCDSAVA
jgi:hypothetical protein